MKSTARFVDTVFITSKPTGGQSVTVRIHKGPMTLDLLRERYLKGEVSANIKK